MGLARRSFALGLGAAGALAAATRRARGGHGVSADTIALGMVGPSNSFSNDEDNLGFRLAFEEASDHHAQRAGFLCELREGRFQALSGWVAP